MEKPSRWLQTMSRLMKHISFLALDLDLSPGTAGHGYKLADFAFLSDFQSVTDVSSLLVTAIQISCSRNNK